MKRSCTVVYILLSLAFIIVNLITLSNLTPWIDEVMMLDTAYNAAFHGSWETTAWYRVAGQRPFSTYPPLYQMLATVWMWLFGSSLTTVRSLNLLITFILGATCLRLMKGHGLRLAPLTVALFTMLLWGTSEMAWMYRNGRPDMLCALVFVLTAQAIDHHLFSKSPTTGIIVVATSALLVCSGIQAAAYLCALWLFLFVVMRQRRREIVRLLVPLLSGLLMGLLLVALFMYAHGRLMPFVCSIIQYSTTLSSVALTVLPWAGDVFGFDPAPFTHKLLELTTESTLLERLAAIVEYRSFAILSITALLGYVVTSRDNLRRLSCDMGFLSLLFALCVPVIMTLAGRFAVYYRWMAFLPLVVAVMCIAVRHRLWCAIFGALAVLLCAFGVKSLMPDENYNYGNICSFVERQHFKSSDTVVCPFSLFYEMKPVCDTCYFVGIFPTEFVGHVDYIIEAPDGNEFDQPITHYVNMLRADSTVVLAVVDRCEHPSLTLYQVRTKHE